MSVASADNYKGTTVKKIMTRIYLMTKENSRKPQLGDPLKAVQSVIASNGVPYFQMKLTGSHSTSGREKMKGKDEQPHPIPAVHGPMSCRKEALS